MLHVDFMFNLADVGITDTFQISSTFHISSMCLIQCERLHTHVVFRIPFSIQHTFQIPYSLFLRTWYVTLHVHFMFHITHMYYTLHIHLNHWQEPRCGTHSHTQTLSLSVARALSLSPSHCARVSARTHVSARIDRYTHIHAHTCRDTHTHTYAHTYMQRHAHNVCLCTSCLLYVMSTHIHASIYACLCTYTHTCKYR
jgi:hypothetical protein